MKVLQSNRDTRLDILKALAIICIVLAHVSAPSFLLRLRNFDVTLMLMVSGASFYASSNQKKLRYSKYIWKRIQRLLIPTWIFLISFFVLFYVVTRLTHTRYPFTWQEIQQTLMLYDGIGYVWIMRVLFLCALINPMFLALSRRIQHTACYFGALLGMYILYRLLMTVTPTSAVLLWLHQNVLLDMLGWGFICAAGIRLKTMTKKEVGTYALLFLVIHLLLMCYYGFASTQGYKYPPTLYYSSYGLFVGFAGYLLLDIPQVFHLLDRKWICWLSTNSFWFYFWHIVALYILYAYNLYTSVICANFVTEYLFVFTVAIFGTLVQQKITPYFFKWFPFLYKFF